MEFIQITEVNILLMGKLRCDNLSGPYSEVKKEDTAQPQENVASQGWKAAG